jgi:hypothetical protein
MENEPMSENTTKVRLVKSVVDAVREAWKSAPDAAEVVIQATVKDKTGVDVPVTKIRRLKRPVVAKVEPKEQSMADALEVIARAAALIRVTGGKDAAIEAIQRTASIMEENYELSLLKGG